MARDFESSTPDYLELASVPSSIDIADFSVVTWVKQESTHNGVVFALADSSIDNQYHILWVASNSARFSTNDGTTAANASGGTTTNGQWHHLGGRVTATSSRDVFLDGTKANNADTRSPTGLDRTSVGRVGRSSSPLPFDGVIGPLAVYSPSLTDAEHALLAEHPFDARMVARDRLVLYLPMWGRSLPEPDVVGGNAFAAGGSPANATHPRLILPRSAY